jgi:hypothetical protein
MINQEIICSDIAKNLKISKSHVSYYISKAKKKNLVKEVLRDTFTSIQITQVGKNFLDQYNKNNLSLPICRLENIQLKAVITKMPSIPVDWKRIQMHNWAQYLSQIDRVRVRLNNGRVPSLELMPSPVEGNNVYNIMFAVGYECLNALLELYDRTGLRVGKMEVVSKPEWVVYDPVAKAFCKQNGQVTYDGIGKVNASKPRDIGELEFHDPRNLIDYMAMPARVKNIETKLDFIIDKLNK